MKRMSAKRIQASGVDLLARFSSSNRRERGVFESFVMGHPSLGYG